VATADSSSSPTEPTGPAQLPVHPGVMTRLQRGIRREKLRTDGTVAWHIN
jgi:hypothetical protein